jgi:hypothetical protein
MKDNNNILGTCRRERRHRAFRSNFLTRFAAQKIPLQSLVLILLSLVLVSSLFAQELPLSLSRETPRTSSASGTIDTAEIESTADVEFIDNTASPSVVNTRNQIESIGAGLGAGRAEITGNRSRYFVIRRRYPAELDRRDADIFGLGQYSGVDTIANLRLIIQGYLQSAYQYSQSDAALLARYITVYNAVYRKNRQYISERYKTPLLNDLTPGSEGIALRWNEWAGQTMMLIPMQSGRPGDISAIDTSAISDSNVIGKMREDPDKAISDRQAMVGIKEREGDQAAQSAVVQRQANEAEQKRIADEQKRLDAEQKRIADEKAAAAAQAAAADTPEEKAEAERRAEELAKKEAELNQDAQELEGAKKDLAQGEAAAAELEAIADRKAEEVAVDRAEISADQKEMITGNRDTPATPPSGVFAVRISGSSPAGVPVKVNTVSGDTLQTSTLSQVYARSVTSISGRIFAAAGQGSTALLIEIDPATLQSIKQSTETVNENTALWNQGGNIYAIVHSGGKNYMGMFSLDLAKLSQSTVEVHPWASFSFTDGKIITQNSSGGVVILKPDLTQ